MRFVFTLLILMLRPPEIASVSAQELPRQQIRGIVAGALSEVPGLAFAIGRDGAVLWEDGLGLAALEPERPATAGTRFRVYSVSKPWTAAAGLRLVASGRLDPEAPIRVAGFPDKGAPITALQLGTHTSGIRHYRAEEAEMNRRCDTVAEAVRIFADDPLLFAPGTDRSYSTWGFVLLGAVIEGAAGRSFDRVLHEEVLEPAGMGATVHASAATPDAALAYERDSTGSFRDVSATADPSCKWGGGGYLSTAADLVRFPLAAISGDLLPPAAVQLLFDPAEGPVDRAGGSGPGGSAHVRTDLDSGVVIAIVANVGGALATLEGVADSIAAAIEADPAH